MQGLFYHSRGRSATGRPDSRAAGGDPPRSAPRFAAGYTPPAAADEFTSFVVNTTADTSDGACTTLAAGTITLAQPLAPGASINVQFLLGVQQPGAYVFFVNVEAVTDPPPSMVAPSKAGAARRKPAASSAPAFAAKTRARLPNPPAAELHSRLTHMPTTGTELMAEQGSRTLFVTRVRQQAREIRSLDMRPDDGAARLVYAPGQAASLRVGSGRPSYFAFASAPEDEQPEFLVKRTGESGASPALYELSEGDAVELVEVAGRGFPLDEHEGRDLVFVAMGTGVAPLRSALRHALARADRFGQLVVLYGARRPADFCYTDEVAQWKAAGVELRQVVSQPDGYEWAGQTGYVQSLLDNVLPSLSSPLALVCGSREMIEHTRDRLREMGLPPESILTNY